MKHIKLTVEIKPYVDGRPKKAIRECVSDCFEEGATFDAALERLLTKLTHLVRLAELNPPMVRLPKPDHSRIEDP